MTFASSRAVFAAVTIVFASHTLITNAAAPNNKTMRFEIRFMQGMIDHHAMAIEMAQLCEGRVIHHELLTTCQQIIEAQSREIETLQRWLADWYGITYSPQMSKQEQSQVAALASLSGAEFEIRFMEMMIQHHQMAIEMASDCVSRAYHKALVRLCERIIAAQSAEIEQFREWLCVWYNRC